MKTNVDVAVDTDALADSLTAHVARELARPPTYEGFEDRARRIVELVLRAVKREAAKQQRDAAKLQRRRTRGG